MPDHLRRPLTTLALALIMVTLTPAPAWADQVRDQQWYLGYLKIDAAHRIATGEGVKVAVIDSGIDSTHPDLQGAVVPGTGTGLAGGDGLADYSGHGTAMAGVIAARGRSGGQGIIGIAPAATVFPVVGGGTAGGPLPEAIDWAVQHGAKVINISLLDLPGTDEQAAVERALAADIVIVAAAGNDPDGKVVPPARFPGVVAVTGVDKDGNRAEFSTTGPEAVLAAPAVDIVSTDRGGYTSADGTSLSTAIVSGVAALIRSKYPNLSATEVIHRMTATAVDKGPPGRDNEYGYGIVDPVAALTADIKPDTTTKPDQKPWLTRDIQLILWIVGSALAFSIGAILAIRRTTHSRRSRTGTGTGTSSTSVTNHRSNDTGRQHA